MSISQYQPLPEGSAQYPVEFIETQGIIKLKEDEEGLEIGITGKAREEIRDSLRNFHRKPVRFIPIGTMELSAYLGKQFGDPGDAEFRDPPLPGEDPLLLDKLANDAPIVNLVNSICLEAIHSGASDIHLEAGHETVRVRYRIDGVLRTVRTLEPNRFPAVSSRIKIMANLNILERRQPQDGRITVSLGNGQADLRVSIVPVQTASGGGESIVLRILGRKAAASSLEELGLAADQLEGLRRLLSLPYGLILMTGPTGSGKTTTLNTMLKELVSDRVKIITIEDPVEFLVSGVSQIQTNGQIGLGFEVILRRVLRQDPNVIMVGEIRDAPAAEIALRAALTGHLVLSTLHTNDTVSAIPRLVNMGIEPCLIASVLRGVMAQRLVRKICPHCREETPPSAEERRLLDRAGFRGAALYRGAGCPACEHTGFQGRTLIAEAFASDPGLEELILNREKAAALEAFLK
jgi:type II secretory ATPase GspE/PulE/Tfp pilus assembly ATPase PilB-like protein